MRALPTVICHHLESSGQRCLKLENRSLIYSRLLRSSLCFQLASQKSLLTIVHSGY